MCKLGGCHFVDVPSFGTEPWLITIGKHVLVSCNVIFITHEGAHWVLKGIQEYKNLQLFSFGKIRIQDNVYIGAGTTILKNVTIGQNTIIGANSLVNKNCEGNSVYAGVPAKKICTIDEWAQRFQAQKLPVDWKSYHFNKRKEVLRLLDEAEKTTNCE